jgi:hypothetical protein
MGGSKVSLPPPTPVDAELQREQVNLLKQQSSILNEQVRLQNLLAPMLLRQQGQKPILDDQGKIIGIEDDPDSIQARRLKLEEGLIAKSEAALAGNLPVDPALERELGQEERTVRETLRRQLGSDYETSTPGSQRLSDLFKRKEELLYAARRGDLTLAEQLSLARQGSVAQGSIGTIWSTLYSPNLTLAQALAGGASAYDASLNRGLQERQLQMNANIENSRQSSARLGSIIGGVTSLVGTGLGAYAALK